MPAQPRFNHPPRHHPEHSRRGRPCACPAHFNHPSRHHTEHSRRGRPCACPARFNHPLRHPQEHSRRGRPCACPARFNHPPRHPQEHSRRGRPCACPRPAQPSASSSHRTLLLGAGLVPALARLNHPPRHHPEHSRRGRPCACPRLPFNGRPASLGFATAFSLSQIRQTAPYSVGRVSPAACAHPRPGTHVACQRFLQPDRGKLSIREGHSVCYTSSTMGQALLCRSVGKMLVKRPKATSRGIHLWRTGRPWRIEYTHLGRCL